MEITEKIVKMRVPLRSALFSSTAARQQIAIVTEHGSEHRART
jgi:hypothetical protein